VATLKAAIKHGLDVGLLAGVIRTESDGYPFAKSRTGAKGPGQVDFRAHKGRFPSIQEERDKYDPAKNIDCAAELLSEYTSKYGVTGGLQAYNIGETAYRKGKRNPRYVAKVIRNTDKYVYFLI
jgi:soluble lytic murein transglycosylase-like protein